MSWATLPFMLISLAGIAVIPSHEFENKVCEPVNQSNESLRRLARCPIDTYCDPQICKKENDEGMHQFKCCSPEEEDVLCSICPTLGTI